VTITAPSSRTRRRETRRPILHAYGQLTDPAVDGRLGFHGVDPNGEVNRTTLDEMQDYFVAIGCEERKLDLATIIDLRYVQPAAQRLGRLA
jgi:hypothetical protein